MKWFLLTVAIIACIGSVMACPFDSKDPLLKLRSWSDQAIVRIDTVGTNECTNTGTGFFINAAGNIITAGHVVPVNCVSDNLLIKVRWTKNPNTGELSDPVAAHVIDRSSLDVALLELEMPPDEERQFLRLEPLTNDSSKYKNRCTLLASHYFEQTDTYSTFAEIVSVSLLGDRRWALSGEGFNPSRSGSPLILSNGKVVALFVARPGNDNNDRDQAILDRAYVLPLANVPTNEINLSAVAIKSGKLDPFLTEPAQESFLDAPAHISGGKDREASWKTSESRTHRSVNTSFGLSITEEGFRIDPSLPFYFYKHGKLSKSNTSIPHQVISQAALTGSSILRQITAHRRFTASPGYLFDPSTITFEVAALNPPGSELPDRPCEGTKDIGCYSVLENGRSLELRINLYPGIDGRRSWIDAEVRITERPSDQN